MDYLPTPTTRDYKDGSAEHKRNGVVQTDTLARAIINGNEVGGGELMPTPKAQDGVKGNLKTSQERQDAGFFVDLPNVAVDLANLGGGLSQPQQPQTGKAQTSQEADQPAATGSQPLLPTTRRSMGNASQPEIEAGDPKKRIENTVLLGDISWGKFEPAIRRWEETIGRPAPAPTKPDGKDGAHRLSSLFTEWMMGLPEGWITGHGLSRNDELKMAGNGVVPQQAELALRILLDGVALPAESQTTMLPTPVTTDGKSVDVKNQVETRNSLQLQSITALLGMPEEVWESTDLSGNKDRQIGEGARRRNGGGEKSIMLPTPTVSDTYTDNLASTQQKPGSMHSVTLPQAVKWIDHG